MSAGRFISRRGVELVNHDLSNGEQIQPDEA